MQQGVLVTVVTLSLKVIVDIIKFYLRDAHANVHTFTSKSEASTPPKYRIDGIPEIGPPPMGFQG